MRNGQLSIGEMSKYAKAHYGDFVAWIMDFLPKANGLPQRKFSFFDLDRNGLLDLPELEIAVATWRHERGAVSFKVYPEQEVMDTPTTEDANQPKEEADTDAQAAAQLNLYPCSARIKRRRPATSRVRRQPADPIR